MLSRSWARKPLVVTSPCRKKALLDSVTFVCLLQACASIPALDVGRQIHALIKCQGLEQDAYDALVASNLVNMFVKREHRNPGAVRNCQKLRHLSVPEPGKDQGTRLLPHANSGSSIYTPVVDRLVGKVMQNSKRLQGKGSIENLRCVSAVANWSSFWQITLVELKF